MLMKWSVLNSYKVDKMPSLSQYIADDFLINKKYLLFYETIIYY